MCLRGNCPFSNLKILKAYKLIAFLKTLQRLIQEWQKSPALGQGKQTAKTWFGLEKEKENQPTFTYCSSSLLFYVSSVYSLLNIQSEYDSPLPTVFQNLYTVIPTSFLRENFLFCHKIMMVCACFYVCTRKYRQTHDVWLLVVPREKGERANMREYRQLFLACLAVEGRRGVSRVEGVEQIVKRFGVQCTPPSVSWDENTIFTECTQECGHVKYTYSLQSVIVPLFDGGRALNYLLFSFLSIALSPIVPYTFCPTNERQNLAEKHV